MAKRHGYLNIFGEKRVTAAFCQTESGGDAISRDWVFGTFYEDKHAYLYGLANIADTKHGYLSGTEPPSPSIPYIRFIVPLSGGGSSTSSIHVYLKGISSSTTSKYAYIKGVFAATPSSKPVYLRGDASVTTSKPTYLNGQSSLTGSKLSFMKGGVAVVGSKTVYLSGQLAEQQIASSHSAYLKGGVTQTDSKSTYLKGRISVVDSASVYVEGFIGGITSRHAFLRGISTLESSCSAMIAGEIAVLNNYIALNNSINSPATEKRFKAIEMAPTYARMDAINYTISGKINKQAGPIVRLRRYTLFVPIGTTGSTTEWGNSVDFESFFVLSNATATPSDTIVFKDHYGLTRAVYFTNDADMQPLCTILDGGSAYYLIPISFMEKN